MSKRHHFVLDVESIGLHGEGFAAGFVVIDDSGTELDSGRYACLPHRAAGRLNGDDAADRAWVAANVPHIAPTHISTPQVRSALFIALLGARERAAEAGAQLLIWAECAWPVEARFLADAIDDAAARTGPYPLHEIATAMLLAGMDPMATYDRLPAELPRHDPLADARQSARLLVEALGRIKLNAPLPLSLPLRREDGSSIGHGVYSASPYELAALDATTPREAQP